MIVTHDDDGRPVDVGRGGLSRAIPGVPRRVADVGVGVEESVEEGVIRAMPAPRPVADVGVGVKEIVEVLRCFDDDVGMGVEDNVVEVADVELANAEVAAIFLFPNASVKEKFIFRPTVAAAFTADRSSLSASDEIIPGLVARWTTRILYDSKSNPVIAQGLEEDKPNTCDMDGMVMAPEEDFVLIAVPNMGQTTATSSAKQRRIKVCANVGTSNPWKATVNSQDHSSS